MNFEEIIDLIKNMDEKDKLRLVIGMNETFCTNIDYDKKEMLEKFETRMKEIDSDYGKNLIINRYILMITARITELSKEEQNKIGLYLFNCIKI